MVAEAGAEMAEMAAAEWGTEGGTRVAAAAVLAAAIAVAVVAEESGR